MFNPTRPDNIIFSTRLVGGFPRRIYCKKRRRDRDDEAYYRPPPPQAHKVDPYYAGPPNQNHVINVAPKPTPPPPPPPPFISSSGGSGVSNLSASDSIYPPPSPGISLGFTKSTFSYDELAMATQGFSESNLLGQGGFGYVHRGVLPNGKEVAVKSLKAGSGQGEREFHAEVEIISLVHHKHLVSLVGYCITGAQRMLACEFVPNDTMEFHLNGKGRPVMDWPTRLRIALGAAKGLAYLHEDCKSFRVRRSVPDPARDAMEAIDESGGEDDVVGSG